MKISNLEQRLLDFAREQFSEHLSQFLLTGLGEEKVGQRGRFTITYDGDEHAVLKRRLEVITYEPTDGTSYLPQRRDPLVLLALLHLLMNGDQGALNTLRFEQKEVLSLLGWKNTLKARREMDEAVKRYFMLTYQWKMNKTELKRENLSFFTANETMISEYQSINTEDEKAARIVFNEHFIMQLLGGLLFGIDWNSVSSISYQSYSKKGQAEPG